MIMKMTEIIKLYKEIKNDHNSCFNVKYIKDMDGALYEKCDFHHHKYRVIFSSDDYDYVEDELTIKQLDSLYDNNTVTFVNTIK